MICTENTLKNTIYSVGTDRTLNLKERIADVHGADSDVAKAAKELDNFISDPESRQNGWYWNFYRRVKSGLSCLYPHGDNFVKATMAQQFIDELINGGYIKVLEILATNSGKRQVSFCTEYADSYNASTGAVLLFGPRGGALVELLHFLAAERIHGQHRTGISCNRNFTQPTQDMWHNAKKICNWPRTINDNGELVPMDVSDNEGSLPDGMTTKVREIWRANPSLYSYLGSNRLSGDIPFQMIEDVFDVVIRRRLSHKDKIRYDQIVEQANTQGIDPFYAVYQNLFAEKRKLKPFWNIARKLLYDYSMSLWEAKNLMRLSEGKRKAAKGVVFKAKKSTAQEQPKKKVPGTIYENNGGYYWIVANKMKPRPLLDPETKPPLPGGFICDNGRYYWQVPRWVKRKRLVPKGEKFSTKDKDVAIKIAKKLWNKIKRENPKLAINIRKHTRVNGIATKNRVVAEKVALEMWKDIQKNKPRLAAKILKDNRPKPKDKWVAQIVMGGKLRCIGSFDTKEKAEAAYTKEFEKVWGYPPGYNVQCIPKMDKVWPTWKEQRARLSSMAEHPRLPVIGKSTETLEPMLRKMQNINWMVDNCIVVLDENSPEALKNMAVKSRGEKWYAETKKQGNRPVVCGSTSIDKDTNRVRITLYGQDSNKERVLTEEIYHIVYEIIRHTNPKTFGLMKKWYCNQLKAGFDPTWHMHEAFAELMVRETELPESTGLPRRVVNYAQKVFSPAYKVPSSIMEEIVTGA